MFFTILREIFVVIEVLFIFNLIIVVHELGHFLAARWRGLVIEEFGVWFGKPLWRKKIGDVYYSFGSMPFGGFVKLPQLADMSAIEGQTENSQPLPKISPLDKIIVAFAGPLFSFALALVFAALVFVVGRPVGEAEASTTIGYVQEDSPAAKAGLKAGDKILSVDGVKVTRWMGMGNDCIQWRVVRSEGETVPLEVERTVNGKTEIKPFNPVPEIPQTSIFVRKGMREIGIEPAYTPMIAKVDLGSNSERDGLKADDLIVAINGEKLLNVEGLEDYIKNHPTDTTVLTVERDGKRLEFPYTTRGAVIGTIMANGPAAAAGLSAGDRIARIDGHVVPNALWVTDYIHQHKGQPLTISILRDGQAKDVTVTPVVPISGSKDPMIGLGWKQDDDGIQWDESGIQHVVHPRPWEQVRQSALSIVNTISALISSKSNLSIEHLGGPVMIARVYYHLFQNPDGWKMALWFSVFFNVNLAIINMLPIPVLDGGHITLALLEAIRRRPVNVRLVEIVQTACAMLVIGYMLFITYFDVSDFFGVSPRDQIRFATPTSQSH
ncbi:MAG: site-2 protease family protein [Chthoniobacteraceae bacterium]